MKTWKLICGSLAVLAAASPAAAQSRTDKTVLMSENPAGRQSQERYGYSDAVIAGDLIFLSGAVAGGPPENLEASYDGLYQRIGRILARAGASYDDIVDITSFHTDLPAQIDTLAKVQKKYLKAPYAAWTAIDIDRLLPDGGHTEIKIVARKPAAAK